MKAMKDKLASAAAARVARCSAESGPSPYSSRGASAKMRAMGGGVDADDGFSDIAGGTKARTRLDRAGRKKANTTVVNVIVAPSKTADDGKEKSQDTPPALPPMPPPMPAAMPPAAGPAVPPGVPVPPPAFSRGGRVKR